MYIYRVAFKGVFYQKFDVLFWTVPSQTVPYIQETRTMDMPHRQQHSSDKLRRSADGGNYSRSAPGGSGPLHWLWRQCTSSILDPVSQLASACSPSKSRASGYKKLMEPIGNICDICRAIRVKTQHLKCNHSSCSQCLERYRILSMGCRMCNFKHQSPNYKLQCLLDENYKSDANGPGTGQPSPPVAEPDMAEHVFTEDLQDTEGIDCRIQTLIHDLENFSIPRMQMHRQTVRDEMHRLQKDSENLPRMIRDHIDTLKELMDRRVPEMVANMRESNQRHQRQLSQQELYVNNMMDTVRSMIERCKDVIDNDSECDEEEMQRVESEAKNIRELTHQVADERVRMHYSAHGEEYGQASKHGVEDGEERRRKHEKMERDVGVICGRVGVQVCIRPKLHVSMTTSIHVRSFIQNVCPVSSQQAWVSYGPYIQLCSRTGRKGQPLHVGEDIIDTALCADGSVLLACTNSVKAVTFGELRELFPSDNSPTGIAELPDGNLLLIEETSIVVRDVTGKLVRKLNCDAPMKTPKKLAVHEDGSILVCDSHSKMNHALLLDREGKLRTVLQHHGLSTRCASFTHQGFILLADFTQDRLDIYTQYGQHLQTIVETKDTHCRTEPRGIQSAVLDPSGDLWVGDWMGMVFIYSMKSAPTIRSSPSRALSKYEGGSVDLTV